MDPKVWRDAQRRGFPYNIPLEVICGVPLVLPLVYLIVMGLFQYKETIYLSTVLHTIGWSFVGYYASDQLIEAFKDTLCKKGLLGRDLNKAGIQKEKKPV